ncbi:hypothetical protein H920_15743 [Fukomys damarensis]|uniref:Uncharacterized protein n=1 Tax=Fukomys damarensis TaxID=885580 RepID=A0A091CTT1_FUKDA|nr:hypothetical protein H920_15743 [Fukomys damarensis]
MAGEDSWGGTENRGRPAGEYVTSCWLLRILAGGVSAASSGSKQKRALGDAPRRAGHQGKKESEMTAERISRPFALDTGPAVCVTCRVLCDEVLDMPQDKLGTYCHRYDSNKKGRSEIHASVKLLTPEAHNDSVPPER